MAPKEHKINKQTAAGITRQIKLTISEKLEITKTMYVLHVSMGTYRIGLLNIYVRNKHKKKITCKNSGQ